MKVGIATLGCKVNAYESEYVAHLLKESGYEITNFEDQCDVYIINTCTVTNTSDVKSRKLIHQAIKRNKDACIVAMGCFIEANKDYRELGLDIVLGNKDKSKIVSLLEEYFKNRQEIRDLYQEIDTKFEDMFITHFESRTRAFVKIQDGCENFCSYCIIPLVRGKCRSKDPNKVLEEIRSLVDHGYQEVILTGIHTGNYGRDCNTDLASLLKEILMIPHLKRLRISSIEITELTEEILELLRHSAIIVDHLHIPLQAGSNPILKAMNRKYDLAYFEDKLNKIRSIRPNISITTDVIVGFPGETRDLFEQTLFTCQKFGFSKIHTFPYSIRSKTVAATMPNQVDEAEKKARARELIQLSRRLEQNYFNKYREKEVEVLVETYKNGFSYGHTGNYLLVKIEGEHPLHQLVKVKITEVEYPYCIGQPLISVY